MQKHAPNFTKNFGAKHFYVHKTAIDVEGDKKLVENSRFEMGLLDERQESTPSRGY
jgi:cold shock CspA family protein